MASAADESGFPRPVGRAPSQREVAILVGRKRARIERAAEGDMVILPVNEDDRLIVEAVTPKVVELLTEIRDQNKVLIEALSALR